MMFLKKTITFFLILISISNFSQEVKNKSEKWFVNNTDRKWTAELPIWVPGFRGQFAYGEFDSSTGDDDNDDGDDGGQENPDRINNDGRLEFYFVGRVKLNVNNFFIQLDAFSGRVGSTFTYKSLIGGKEKDLVDISIQGTIPRLITGYSVWNYKNKNGFKIQTIPYVGLHYVRLNIETDILNDGSKIEVAPNWFAPVIGIYLPISYRRFSTDIQLDTGIIENKRTICFSNRYMYRVSKLISIQAGVNVINIKHDSQFKGENLKFNISLVGPAAGIGFNF